MATEYKIPIVDGLVVLQQSEIYAKGALFGIGIKRAILKEKYLSDTKSDTSPNYQIPTGYDPDVQVNEFGAHISGSGNRWHPRMSSSLIGMPVMSYIRFIGNTYLDLEGIEQVIPDIYLDTVLISATLNRNIVKTDVIGKNTGSIKELMSLSDWNVEIRAIITADQPVNNNVQKVNSQGVYPRDNMSQIMKLIMANVSIPIECWYLNQLGINYLTIDAGFRIEQVEGEYSQQRVILPCISDNPLIIKIAQ